MITEQSGSPPHTREESLVSFSASASSWITPAYAGRILLAYKLQYKQRDHPRIRGKNRTKTKRQKITAGSPPHTREELLVGSDEARDLRITPAYAGRILWKFFYQ